MRRAAAYLIVICAVSAAARADLAEVVRSSGVKGGLIVHVGCGDGRQTLTLRVSERFLVHALDADAANVRAARANIRAAGVYGKVSACRFDGRSLPYVDNLVNLVVAEDLGAVPAAEVMRVLAPGGVACVKRGGKWTKTVKPRPETIDEWTHFLHGPDNNAVGKDRVAALPRSIQWVSGPRWGRSHEELASMSAAVSAGGRIFYILDQAPLASIRFLGQWALVGRDAFNGTLLWRRDIPLWSDHLRHFRAGPVHLPRRLAAVGDRVYATLGLAAPVTALDAATGETVRVYKETERTEEILAADGVLYLLVGTSEVYRRGGGLHERGEPKPTAFRYVAAVDTETGKRLWKAEAASDEFILPLSLTVQGDSVFYQSTAGLVRLDARSGKEVWKTPRATPGKRMSFSAPTVVAAGDVLLCADRAAGEDDAARGKVEWGVHGWNERGFARRAKSVLRAHDVATGKVLWQAPCSEGYNSPVDVFVVGDTVWVGSDYKGYDLKTGKAKAALKWKGARVGMPHHRCYRNKATERFIFTGRSGIEVVSLAKGWIGNNSWIRGTCQYGILPCNGLLYAPPNACACYSKVKLAGFFAAAPQRGKDGHIPLPPKPVLEKGPALAEAGPAGGRAAAAENPQSGDWPTYRHDAARSGTASTTVAAAPKLKWSAEVGGRLTQVVSAAGRAFVASIDAHTVHALGADDGKVLWSYTAGGRIDSPPTLHGPLVLFGSADGWVYALRAADGALAWRFRAAPRQRLAAAFGQLESVWPVHGAILVQNDTLYCTAGRSTYLDGGMVLYRLDPLTGRELSKTVLYDLDPQTGKQLAGERRFDMEGATSDVLSGDGESVFLKHLRFDRQGKKMAQGKAHLFAATGFLGEEWFVRSYWLIGANVGTGWGAWANMAKQVPAGRILSLTAERVYGYGRVSISSGATGHRADAYHLFCRKRKAAKGETPAEKPPAGKRGKRRRGRKSSMPPLVWSDSKSITVRAMVAAGDRLALAGPPRRGRKTPKLLAFENEREALAAFRGKEGVLLRVLAAADGRKLFEHKLPAMPVFDGLSAADGRLFLAMKNGTVQCWGE